MFQIIKTTTNFNFTKWFPLASILSIILVVGSIILGLTHMNYGVDFRGGAEIQLKSETTISLNQIRELLDGAGFKGVSVQTIGDVSENEYLVKVQSQKEDLNRVTENISAALSKSLVNEKIEIRKVDIVGPKAGAELRKSGFLALFWAILAIMIYVGLRFDFKYAPGAVVALIHDTSIIIGVFALTQTEFTLQSIAALLAVIGYSVNDTVVVYDRVREYEEKKTGDSLKDILNRALNETLSRTILTSGFTLGVCLIMWFMGGASIADFFMAMSAGILVGTYSSLFIAAPITIIFEKMMLKKKAN